VKPPLTVALGQRYERTPGLPRSWPRRIGCVAAVLLLAAVAALLEANLGSHVHGVFPVRVGGRIVDAATGEPVAGVWVVPMRSLQGSATWASVTRRSRWAT
jgi:hypothetical protein